MGRHDQSDWCILRTRGPSTLRLVASLQEAGVEAWTPTEHIRRRIPRGKAVEYRLSPITPTYVFVRRAHLDDMRNIERAEVSLHPRFSVFRYYGVTVFVRHAHLHALRLQQQDSYVASLPKSGRYFKKGRGAPLEVGEEVVFANGPMAGIHCYVQQSDDRVTTLTLNLFGRSSEMQVDTLQLRSRDVLRPKIAA